MQRSPKKGPRSAQVGASCAKEALALTTNIAPVIPKRLLIGRENVLLTGSAVISCSFRSRACYTRPHAGPCAPSGEAATSGPFEPPALAWRHCHRTRRARGRLAQDPQGFVSSITGSGTELGLRFAAYALLLTLSLLMRSGRGWARWALLVVFGGLGTFSLIFEPVGWLMAGGSAATFLAKADAATWAMILSRVAHLLCVWGAILLMFAPTAHAFFTRRPALGLQA